MAVILVTGSAGLVGSEVVRFYARQGYDVIGVDNDMRSQFFGTEASTRWNAESLIREFPHNYHHHHEDIRNADAMERIFKSYEKNIALVVHAAAQPSHDWASRDALTDFSINASATLFLLELVRRFTPQATFIFTSTNKVYGDQPNRLPLTEQGTRWEIDPAHAFHRGIDETMSIDQSTHSLFGVSKTAADLMVQEYGKNFGINTGVFRGGCLTGPMHSGTALHGFLAYLMRSVIEKRPYQIIGHLGKQVRDNIHSSDLVRAFDEFFRNPKAGEVYNIGGSRFSNCSMIEAIVMCQELTGQALELDYADTPRTGDHIWYISDVSKFQRHYPNWSLRYSIPEILQEIYQQVSGAKYFPVRETLKQLRKEAETTRETIQTIKNSVLFSKPVRVFDSIDELKQFFGFRSAENMLPSYSDDGADTKEVTRRIRDAQVLTTLSRNIGGTVFEIGTSFGYGAWHLAANNPTGVVHTVNLLPEQFDSRGLFPTHLIGETEIGSFYRSQGLTNVVQHFANTLTWDVPAEIKELGVAFIDGDHATDVVFSDSKLVFDRLKEGGFLLWHDFNPALRHEFDWIDASMRGVEKFIATLDFEPEIFHLRDSWIGILRKPERKASITVTDRSASNSESLKNKLLLTKDELDALDVKSKRCVWAYGNWDDRCIPREEGFVQRMRALGYDIVGFPLDCKGGWWPFERLDMEYRAGSPELVQMYSRLEELCRGRDVLIAAGGSMLHPDFIRTLSAYTVFYCGDDPESSHCLSQPVAPSFDCACPSNIACLDMYRSWGCDNVQWVYHGLYIPEEGPPVTESSILHGERDIDIILLCERVYNASDRAQRIETLVKEFPQAFVRGKGWPGGFVDNITLNYKRAKIGWNLHNSTGPTNSRVIHLPQLGVMQICDNKSNLGRMFELNKEVVGFDSVAECIDATRYYLAHDNERRKIAAAGWKRVTKDYSEELMLARLLAPAVLNSKEIGSSRSAKPNAGKAHEFAMPA